MSIFRRKERRACPSNTPRPCLQGVPLASRTCSSCFRAFDASRSRRADLQYISLCLEKCDCRFRFLSVSSASKTINHKQSIGSERPISLPTNIFLFLVADINRKYHTNKARKTNYQSRLKIDRCIDYILYSKSA